MKILRIDDKIHEQLKKEAKREGRTLQWVVEKKLTNTTENVHTNQPSMSVGQINEPTIVADSQEWSE